MSTPPIWKDDWPPAPYDATRRDRAAWWLATLVLHLASKRYQNFLFVAYRFGLERLEWELQEARKRDQEAGK